MTFQEIIDQAKIDIGQDGTSGLTDTELMAFALEGDIDFCRFTQANQKLSTAPVTAYQSFVSLPVDFLEGRQTRWSSNLLMYPKTQRQIYYDSREWVYQVSAKPINIIYWNYNNVRLFPIPSAAGTVSFRHAYIRTTATLTDEPMAPKMWHGAITDFVCSEAFYAMREYENADANYGIYVAKRAKARPQFTDGQMTPDTLGAMRPKTNFNWQLWNQRTT